MAPDTQDRPAGELAIRTLAMPADANPSGDIFGGWVLAQMDVAGGIAAARYAGGRVATVAIDAMTFHLPVYIGDVLGVYTRQTRVGTTSVTYHLEAWAERRRTRELVRVTEGLFVFVALDDNGRPRAIAREEPAS